MAAETVRVHGLKELQRDFKAMGPQALKDLRAELRQIADPVREEATRLFSPLGARSASGYRVVARMRGVAVEQKFRTTTGLHPEWGRVQLGVALIPALERKENEVVEGVEDVLDRLAVKHGF